MAMARTTNPVHPVYPCSFVIPIQWRHPMTISAPFAGRWRKLANISADNKGSIHDDEAAQKLGFRGAFVPGSVVGTAALEGAFEHFGSRFLERGWYDLTFVSPVYEQDDVRALAEPVDGDDLAVRVEDAGGRLCCSGRTGLDGALPWRAEDDGGHGAEGVLPGVAPGTEFESRAFSVMPRDIEPLLTGSGEVSEWYTTKSPWGGPVVPPERLQRIALDISRTRRLTVSGVREPGMWAGHALVMRAPLFLGRVYTMSERVVDKGRSGRAIFLTYEFRVTNGAGEEVAVGRHKVKWLAAE